MSQHARGPRGRGRAWRLLLPALVVLLHRPAPAGAQRAGYPFERLAQEEGLSHGTVTVMLQGRAGFLWFGTEDGLNRYDGAGFTVFRPIPGDTLSLAHAWITALAPSQTGGFWIGTLRGGLHRLVDGGFRRYRHRPGDSSSLGSDQVNAVVEARDGITWVGTNAGLDRLDPATGRIQHLLPTPHPSTADGNDVLALALDASGHLWVSAREGLYRFDPRTNRFESLRERLQARQVRVLLADAANQVWAGTEDELLVLDARTAGVIRRWGRSTPANPTPVMALVNALWPSPDGRVWVGTGEGMAIVDAHTGGFVPVRNDPRNPTSLGGKIVRSGMVDRGGVLWVGTESYGLSKHAPSAIHFLTVRHDPTSAHSLSDGYVRGIAEDRAGNLWIGTQYGGLNRLRAETGEITAFRHRAVDPGSLPGDAVWTVLVDHAGELWVGMHDHGAGTFDRHTGRYTPSPLVPPELSVNVLYEDRAGTLFVGLDGKGLIEIDRDRRTARTWGATVGDRRVLTHDDVQAVLEDRQGFLWVGGANGLTRIDRRTGHATQFRAEPGRAGALGGEFVTNIVEDHRGTVWVATKGGGLNRFDARSGTFTAIGPAQGLPSSFVYGVLEDAHGRLWVSTDDGIAMLNLATNAITAYGLQDGLQGREFNRRAHLRGRDGTMYFGGVNGLNAFRPDEITIPSPPPMSLLQLRIAGGAPSMAVRFTTDSVVHLRPGQNAFTISYAALDFSSPRKLKFAYRLEGFDEEWIPAGNRTQATYASLPPGRYVFRVTAANAAGVWNPRPAGVTLVVHAPWWATWWARGIALVILAGIAWVAIVLRLRTVRRRTAWLEERVAEQTRDLRAAQSQLRVALDEAHETARELFDITASVPGAVFQLAEDADGVRRFPFVSEGIARLVEGRDDAGASADPRHLAESILAAIHPDDASGVEAALAASRASLTPWHAEFRLAGAPATRWLSVQARPTRTPRGSTVWTGVVTDITAARAAEAERTALEAKMQQAQKAESLGVLAGGMAHDFNNLLVGVLGSADLLRDSVSPASEEEELLGHIRSSAIRAAELTQQMLAYAGKGRFVVEPVELTSLTREMVHLLRRATPRTIELTLEEGTARPVVQADATQLRQVIMNLVTNAREAIGDAVGRIHVKVAIAACAPTQFVPAGAAPAQAIDGPCAVVEVSDDGPGMDDALLARIFDPFFTTKFTGRGLGLAATLGIVRSHRGGIDVETAPGRGTTFRIYLPVVASPAPRALDPALADGSAGAAARRRVVVVDDEDAVRLVAERALRRFGYEVASAPDGEAAIALLDQGVGADLALVDLTMPRMDGIALAHALRERAPGLPIVIMSGYTEEELAARGVTGLADGFLKKPFTLEELAATVREAVTVG